MKKFLSWNVNGIRAIMKKGFENVIENGPYNVIAVQEVKANEDSIPEKLKKSGYNIYVNSAKKKGYSGTLVLSKEEPIQVIKGMGDEHFDNEGRVLTLEFRNFWFVNAYFPNSQRDLARLDYKIEFGLSFEEWCMSLDRKKPLIICGDFNVAHKEIDLAKPQANLNNAGFTAQERSWLTDFLAMGYTDTFRMFVKSSGHYTWWSYLYNSRAKNIGWRVDYFIVSNRIAKKVINSKILDKIKGSDHAPIELDINI